MKKKELKQPVIIRNFADHIRYVEKQMAMTVEEFQAKLREIQPARQEEARKYRKMLDEWLNQGKDILTNDKRRTLELSEGEYFVPCYSPDKPVCRELPTIWFMSNYGNLVSISTWYCGYKVIWLPPKSNGSDRDVQGFHHPVTGQHRTMKHYAIVAAVLDADVMGIANHCLEMFGSYAFGGNESPYNVNVHHKLQVKRFPDLVYDIDNIQLLSVQLHNIIRHIRRKDRPDGVIKLSLSDKAIDILREELPCSCVVIETGIKVSSDGKYLSSDGAYSIDCFINHEQVLNRTEQLIENSCITLIVTT